MCVYKSSPPEANKSPRSPYRRCIREISKPKLSRRVIPSSRVNLNSYWSKFEAISHPSTATFVDPKRLTTLDNEINENLANELAELGN